MNQQKRTFSDGGFTRVSVLLGVVLAFAVVLMLSFAPRALRSSAPIVVSDVPLQEALQDSLGNFVKTKLVQTVVPCGEPMAFYQSHSFLRLYQGSVGQAKADPPAGLSAAAWDELFHGSMAAHSFAGAALSRCSLTVLGTGGRFHFCVNVQRDAQAPRDSFLRAPLTFAEVSIQLLDRKNGKPLSCQQYMEPGRTNAGATIEYLLFTVNEKGKELEVTKSEPAFQ